MGPNDDHLAVDTGSSGCFSAERLELRLGFVSNGALVECRVTQGVNDSGCSYGPTPIDPEVARRFVTRVLAVFDREHTPFDGRSTISFNCTVRWQFGGKDGIQSVQSAALEREAVREIASDATLAPDLVARAAAALNGGMHDWAHEIFRLSRGFVVANIPAAAAALESGSS